MRGRPISRILSRGLPPMDDHSSDDTVADAATAANPNLLGQKQPRPRYRRHAVPIWHCSRWGLPCRPCCQRRGGLLPHLFTLPSVRRSGHLEVCFLWRFPSGCPARALPGTVSFWSPDFPTNPEGSVGHPAFRAPLALAALPCPGQVHCTQCPIGV